MSAKDAYRPPRAVHRTVRRRRRSPRYAVEAGREAQVKAPSGGNEAPEVASVTVLSRVRRRGERDDR